MGNRLRWGEPGESRHFPFVRLRPVCAFGRISLMVATCGAAFLRVGFSLSCTRMALSIYFLRPHRALPHDRVGSSQQSQFLVRLTARTFRMGLHVFLFRAFPRDIAGGHLGRLSTRLGRPARPVVDKKKEEKKRKKRKEHFQHFSGSTKLIHCCTSRDY